LPEVKSARPSRQGRPGNHKTAFIDRSSIPEDGAGIVHDRKTAPQDRRSASSIGKGTPLNGDARLKAKKRRSRDGNDPA
jgi:hypothetical protein